MESVNYEYYVSLEVAKLLKEAGFKWRINTAYRDGVLVFQGNLLCDNFNGKQYENAALHEFFSAPTLEVAQRWIREVKAMHICVKPNEASANCEYFITVIVNDTKWGNIQDDNRKTIMFDTYEEAQEAGIKKALEIILEKGE